MEIDFRHHSADFRLSSHCTEHLKYCQRFSDRAPAYTKRIANISLSGNPIAGLEPVLDNVFSYPVNHVVDECTAVQRSLNLNHRFWNIG